MKFSLGYILAIGILGFIFTKTSYNNKSENLRTYYLENDIRFITEWYESTSNKFHSNDSDKHLINLITFISANQNKKDSTFCIKQDSLLNSLHTKSLKIQSRVYTEQVYVDFIKKFHTTLIQKIHTPVQEDIDYIDELIDESKEALRKDYNNKVARHNLEVLIKVKQHSDFYYQKAHDISDLIYKQLKEDLNSDTTRFIDKSIEYYPKQYEKIINQISTPEKKAMCKKEINDSLQHLINSKLTQHKFNETVDSIQTYDNIDLSLISKLKSKKSSQEIINDFYQNDYPTLYGKTSKESLLRILKDENTNLAIKEIIKKYLDKDPNKDSNSDSKGQKNDSEKKQDQQKNKNQENSKDQESNQQNQNQQGDSKKQDKKGKQGDQKQKGSKGENQNKGEKSKKGEDQEKGSNGQQNDLEDFENEQKQNSSNSSSDKKKGEMKEGLKGLDQKKQDSSPKSEYGQKAGDDLKVTDKTKNKTPENTPQDEQPNASKDSNLSKKLQQHNMTKEGAEQTLKSIEQKADRYLQSRKRAGKKDIEYGTKPDW